jgi:beta-lactamase class A
MRLPAGDRLGATIAVAALLVAACGPSPSTRPLTPLDAGPSSEPAPANVTVVPLTPGPADVVRPLPPGVLDGDLIDATAESGRCPDPFPEDHPLRGTETVRLDHAEEVPPPTRLDVPPPVTDAGLEEKIRDRLGGDEERYAVVVKDLRDGRGVAINAERIFYAASLFKLEVMFEVFHQREAGLIDFGERYIASDYYAQFGLGPHLIAQCDEVTVEQALGAMMSVSDNTAAVMLQDRAGAGNINASMRALGLEHTALLSDALPLTAADVALLLEAVARGDAVSEDASQEMVDLLATEKIDDRIPSGVPEGTLVAHKTGNWENATHDAGIVYGEKSAYVVVLLSDIGFDGDAGSVERDIMRIAWEWFEGDGA